MIDFHTHIIPNIDDGSKSVEETFNLLKEAQEVGFEKIISTSHYLEDYYETENSERKVWIDALNEKAQNQNINVKIYPGNEIYLSENIIDLLETEKASTINNTSYVLFELPMNIIPINLDEMIYEMIRAKLVPILAHPERYSFIQKDINLVYDLIEDGVLMQCNFGSFIGIYGTKAELSAKQMLKNNMVHFLGSDVHRQKSIYPKIPKALSQIKKLVGEEKLKELTQKNPELVLNNKKVEIDEPKKIKHSVKNIIKILK